MPGSGAAELDAAGVTDPALRAAYATCRALNAAHGRTYFLATRLLPAGRRPAVHALYGFARYADEIVDDLDDDRPIEEKAAELDGLTADLDAALDGAPTTVPVLVALADTARRYAIDRRHFTDFMVSMRMDTTVTEYATFDDLGVYVHGSAAVIGLQMLPILGTRVPRAEAEPPAAALGVAFQLTNFLRDIAEDLRRGRVYLPQESLDQFGVDRDRLARGRVDESIRNLLAWEIERARRLYAAAAPGIELVEPGSRDCLRTASTLYAEILDEIERADYDVFSRRVRVGPGRRAAVGLTGLRGAWTARHGARPLPTG
jgi:phytoene synthase